MGAWDDVKNEPADLESMVAARKEEVEYMCGKGVWTVVDIEESWQMTGRAPVSVRWVDTVKASGARARLVARDFRPHRSRLAEDLVFAATPPLELKRMQVSRAARRPEGTNCPCSTRALLS